MQQFSFFGMCWSVSLPSDKLNEIQQLAHANLFQSFMSCPFWARPSCMPIAMDHFAVVPCDSEFHVEYLSL